MPRRSRKSVSLLSRSVRRSLPIEALEDRTLLSLLGQQLYPSDYPWNQNISTAPVAINSNAIMNSIISEYGNGRFHPDFGEDDRIPGAQMGGIPYNVIHGNSTPKISVIVADTVESDVVPAPILNSFAIEGDNQTGPASQTIPNPGDSHLVVWDEDNNIAYEFDECSRPSQNSDGQWHAAEETVWYMNTDQFRTIGYTSVDAAGLSILSGLARPDEGLPTSLGGQGVINHAIRVTLQNDVILNQFIYPATHEANSGSSAATQPPMGARFRLKSVINIAGLDPQSKIIAQALKTYGLIVADNGGNFYISGASYSVDANNNFTTTWNENDLTDTNHGLMSLPYSDFEMVNLTPMFSSVSPSSGLPGQTITITGQNFSGAAGHLSVLFGSVATATSVTVLSDTQITAVVPSGPSGWYDVRVQSGQYEPDTQNVNNPIFGYGTTAISLSDHFTFVSPATVTGRAFQDNNADGSFNGADTGLSGQTVYLDENNNGTLDSGEPSTAADSNGNYTFSGLSAVSGTVRLQTPPTGYVLDNSSANGFTTTSGGTSTVNVAYFPTTYTGTTGNDTYALQLDGSGANINVLLGGVLTYSAPTSLASSLIFNLGADAGALTVNNGNGNPIPSGGITVSGGASADGLIFSAPTANSTVIVTANLVLVGGSTIHYSGLSSLAFNAGSGNDTLTQTAQPGNGATLAFNVGSGVDTLNVSGGNYTVPGNPPGNLSISVGGGSKVASVSFAGNASGVHGIDAYSLTSLTVNTNGTATLASAASGLTADRTLLTTNSLSVTGSVDLMGNSIDVHYGSGSDPFSTIRDNVIGGQITSSLNDAFHAVGYADGTDGIVKSISSGDILIRYTVMGDANLDGSTGFADLSKVAQNYNATNTTWDTGDFMGTGTTSFVDLVKVAQNYNASLTSTQVGASQVPPTLS